MGNAELLRDLRVLTGTLDSQTKEFWHSPDFPSGVAKGIVAELLGNARTEWLLKLFASNPEPFIFWCEKECLINPTALHQRGIPLDRIHFINSEGDLQQPLRLILESQHYPFIVAPNTFTDIKVFQRLSLFSEKSKSTLFLLGEKEFSQAWPISLQLEINFAADGFEIFIQRQKHGVGE